MAVNHIRQGTALPGRIDSIDVLRGITILVMIFVNDIAGVTGTPAWLKHISPSSADGMTLVDVVFPAFLFIVGMSIPLAVDRRLKRGDSFGDIWKHILIRTLGLLVIGVFMVNSESVSEAGFLNPHLWTLLMYAGIFFVWLSPVEQSGKKRNLQLLRWGGCVLLLLLAFLYRGPGQQALLELRTQWWGIIGLIGWAYLVACLVYIPFRNHKSGLLGMAVLLYLLYMADRAGLFSGLTIINSWLSIGEVLGSHAAIVVSGTFLGKMLSADSVLKSHAARMRWALLYGIGLAAAAVLLHSLNGIHDMFIYNKIRATPPWCLLSSALTVFVWLGVYWLVDVRGWKRWAGVARSAGQNALFAYILAPFFYSLFALLAVLYNGSNIYHWLGGAFAVGLWRSILFALLMAWTAGMFSRRGIRLKL